MLRVLNAKQNIYYDSALEERGQVRKFVRIFSTGRVVYYTDTPAHRIYENDLGPAASNLWISYRFGSFDYNYLQNDLLSLLASNLNFLNMSLSPVCASFVFALISPD